ncbi:hypothetical protein C7S13_3948 [Burkholderia cepacia]|nr:hypothetical protein [Burkholderia cepacia]
MRCESPGSAGFHSGSTYRIRRADGTTIGATPGIGYRTRGERAIRDMQIIGGGGRKRRWEGAEGTAVGVT